MTRPDPVHDIELLVRSRHGFVVIDSDEDDRVLTLLTHLADIMQLPLFTWTRTRGVQRAGSSNGVYGTTDPAQALAHIYSNPIAAIYLLQDFGSLINNEDHQARLKDIAEQFTQRDGALILNGVGLELPAPLARIANIVSLPKPELDEYRHLVMQILRDIGQRMPVKVQMKPDDQRRLLYQLQGLTLMEAEKILTKAIIEDGSLTADDIARVIDAKKEIVGKEGVLEYYPLEEHMTDIADMAGLKAWLAKRKNIILEPDAARQFGLTFPKGLLLIGVPGCGKSLCAKAVAMEWGLPLLKLDPGSLYNKFIGETEKNFKRAMQVAERLAPVVLWIDELEKAFAAGGDEDGGVSQRVLGSFLSWMQDRRGDVFTVATANDVSKLPAEFLRKGRFDEIFFVDLPDVESRKAILEIHLKKRKQDPTKFDLAGMVAATDGFSGAEIEEVIVSALYTVFSEKKPLTTEAILKEASATKPLATTMAERISSLREWSKERTVPAN